VRRPRQRTGGASVVSAAAAGTPAAVDGRPAAAPALEPTALPDAGRGGYRAVLRNRAFLLVWAAQVLSQTAQNVVNYALVVEVEQLTHSSTNVGWVIVSFSLPALLLGPSAGVFVDRMRKRHVLLWTNLLRALLMVGFLLLPRSLQTIYLVTFVASAVSQFFAPAEGAIIPLLVRRHELMPATSLFNITFTGAQVAGFVAIGPTLYKLLGVRAAIIATVAMYALAAACIALIPRVEQLRSTWREALARALHLPAVWRDMLEARRFLGGAPGVTLAIAHLALATGLLMTLATLGPGFVARVLGLTAADAGYVLAPAGLGMLVTTVLLGHFAIQADRRRLAGIGLVAMAISLAALAFVRPGFDAIVAGLAGRGPSVLDVWGAIVYLGAVCAITFSLGVEFSLITIPAQTVVSEATEPSVRGRVFALLFMLTGTASALPVLAIGALADHVGIVTMLFVLAALVALAGLASLRPVPGAAGGRSSSS